MRIPSPGEPLVCGESLSLREAPTCLTHRPLRRGDFEIGRILHLKPEIRNLQLDCRSSLESYVHLCVSWGQSEKADEIQRRLINFGARTTRVAKMLPRTDEGRYISRQLLRSGLAAAPNYAEATAAESRADFIHKLRIVLKELNETMSWLEQIVANGLFSRYKWPRLSRRIRNSAGSLRPPFFDGCALSGLHSQPLM